MNILKQTYICWPDEKLEQRSLDTPNNSQLNKSVRLVTDRTNYSG